MQSSGADPDSVTAPAGAGRQPFLHDLVCTLAAPAFGFSGGDGQIRGCGVQGYYVADRRVLSQLTLAVDGLEPVAIHHELLSGGRAIFMSTPRGLGDNGPDPSVIVERVRDLRDGRLTETLTVRSYARQDVQGRLSIAVATDLAQLSGIKSGRPQLPEVAPVALKSGLRWSGPGGLRVTLTAQPAPDEIDAGGGELGWNIDLCRGAPAQIVLQVESADEYTPAVVLPGANRQVLAPSRVDSSDSRLDALYAQSVEDLRCLQLCDPLHRDDVFLAAGAPWFLTLFGRDSIWAARMLLPLGTDLAGGTLRALARRQGSRLDPHTAEEPGKIAHEIRREAADYGALVRGETRPLALPPLYYGTVDATPLWISLLHDAWRWGLPAAEVHALLPNLERALGWMSDHGLGASGFLQYADASGHGLSNQGWKDSGDSIQFGDGRLARPPIALCEVQAYAHAAALHGAALLDAFDRPGSDRWRQYAATLQRRFREAFWTTDQAGSYPAVALDRHGRPVDTVTSNLGHLLGTGLLNAEETALVVARLAGPELTGRYGLRTMSTRAAGYNPLAYHGGSIWTHDTAIAIAGLRGVGTPAADAAAAALVEGLLSAAPHFEYRLPELFASVDSTTVPVPYPAACRPQAWSAAAAVTIVQALLGLDIDVPNASLQTCSLRPAPINQLNIAGVRAGSRELNLKLDSAGDITVTGDITGLTLRDVASN